MALVPFPSKVATRDLDDDPEDDQDDPSSEAGGKMSFLDHLDELRKRLVWSLVSVVAGFLVACVFYQQLFDFVITPIQAFLPRGQKLIFTEPTEAMMIYVKICVIAGILLSLIPVMTQVWLFISPGLYSKEKKLAIPFVLLSSFFFVSGAAFAHYVVFPLTMRFLASWESDTLTYMPRIDPTFSLYMKLVLIFGGIFQMPTLVLFLARMGIITARFLVRNMKYAILIMFIVGAVLSPGTDPVGQLAMAGPMFVLYLISIALAWLFGKKKRAVE